MKPKDIIKILLQNGWQKVSVKGSHYKFKKGDKVTIVAYHNKDLKPKTLESIERQTGLKFR